MYQSVIATMVLAFGLSGIVHADNTHHPAQGSSGKPAQSEPAKSPAGQEWGMSMGMMQESMLKMHAKMHEIMQAKDAKERDRLMQEHMGMLQQHMKNMQGTMGSGMMGSGMMGGGAKGGMTGAPAGK